MPLFKAASCCLPDKGAVPAMQTYVFNGQTFVSSLLHHVQLTGIPYGTPIYYQCALYI